MSILEYNARLHEETLKKEGYEDGLAEGRAVIIQMIHNALSKGHTPEEIVDFMGASLEDVLSVQEKMLQEEQGDNL